MVKLAVFLLVLLVCSNTVAQLPPISVEKGENITNVHTNRLNVIDAPDQFFQIEFWGAYSAKDGSSAPFELYIRLHSFTTQALYRQHSNSRLIAFADGERVPLGLALYDLWYGQQTMNRNQSRSAPASFPEETRLPPGSKLESAHSLKNIVMESLVLQPISFEGLLRLAKAQRVEMEFGVTRFQLNELQMDRLRLFVKSVTPPSFKPVAPANETSPNTGGPSDENQTPLKETMEWLQSTLSSLTAAPVDKSRMDFDWGGLSKCEFKYTETTANGAQKIYFASRFADLDPEAVSVLETPFKATLRYATKDTELKIKEDSHSHTTYNDWQEKYLWHARTIDMKRDLRARELHVAFVHAIRLCEKNP